MEKIRFWLEAVKSVLAEAGSRLHFFIGSNADTIAWWQMCIRGVLIFLYCLFLVRVGGKRIFGKNTSFDIVLGVILGSILSRALTANAQFIPTLAAATTLVFLHLFLANMSFHIRIIGHLIKGKEVKLVSNGNILWKNMKKANVTEHDLQEALRSNAKSMDIQKVKSAFLERNGDISFIT